MALVEKSAAIGCAGETDGLELGAAERAEKGQAARSWPRTRFGVSAAMLRVRTSSGRMAERTEAPGGSATRSATRSSRAPTLTRSGPGHDGVEEGHVPDEIGDEGRRRIAIDLLRRADLLDDALVHHDDAVRHGERLLLVVRHHDGGDAEPALQRADLVAQAHPHLGVEGGERLVEQQQARRGRERARQRHALLLTAGELHRIFVPWSARPTRASSSSTRRLISALDRRRLTRP